MEEGRFNSNQLFSQLVANSLFTPKQVAIIYNRMRGGGRLPGMTSGAYFRQVKQCQDKVQAVLYTAVLLQSTDVLDAQSLAALGQLSEQLRVIFARDARDILPPDRTESVMSVMSQVIKRVSRL
ncbi:MAG TPA: hypothetical protein VJ742_02595 [Nitrososphaera sp.]|nr:hypothetical protein [Nitrososphaera sp.]